MQKLDILPTPAQSPSNSNTTLNSANSNNPIAKPSPPPEPSNILKPPASTNLTKKNNRKKQGKQGSLLGPLRNLYNPAANVSQPSSSAGFTTQAGIHTNTIEITIIEQNKIKRNQNAKLPL